MANFNFIDTDLFIDRLDYDPALSTAAEKIFELNHPSAMSSLSLLELKGNYISDLILLHRKISESDSFTVACAKIRRIGGRKYDLMFARLIKWISEFSIHPWDEARRELLTCLDGQLSTIWDYFRNSVDMVFDDFKCTRAEEVPEDDGTNWRSSIPLCVQRNTRCSIINFMKSYDNELRKLCYHLDSLDPNLMTQELYRIKQAANDSIEKEFPWEGRTCRRVADLIIGLHSKAGNKLISSNRKEHSQLHIPLGYQFEHFDIVEKRTK